MSTEVLESIVICRYTTDYSKLQIDTFILSYLYILLYYIHLIIFQNKRISIRQNYYNGPANVKVSLCCNGQHI